MEKILKELINPSKEYRSIPFWAWNDQLEIDVLREQINQMEQAGLGGFFMHARGGLKTDYLSEEWMASIEACIEEGKKNGMGAWCYDENGWPSGFAGGLVTALGDSYHVRHLEIEEIITGEFEANDAKVNDNETNDNETRNKLEDTQILGIYILDEENELSFETYEEFRSKDKAKLNNDCMDNVKDNIKRYIIRHKSNPYYIDILNKDVVKTFIETTHEVYYKHFGEEFGKGMPGFFTDEPQYSRELMPWSYILPDLFKQEYGYDMIPLLPALFIECKGYEMFRYDYWALVSDLYLKSFGKQIYDWCDEHRCELTGHTIEESSLLWQMYCCAGVMPFYEYMHRPGMDWLGRRIDGPLVPKQVSSVANQLQKKFVLSETFALCGWDVSFEELKWIAEWQFVNGVNLLCQHLESYSIRGFRKRDYPPSLFHQQSWWEEYKAFNDYFARLTVLLTSGEPIVNVLLLHPMKSAWIDYNLNNNDQIKGLDSDLKWATDTLSALHIDHHYGDETIIARHGRVEGNKFIVGQCAYQVVVLPSMKTLDLKTLELLEVFLKNGGNIISIGDFPSMCSGRKNQRLELLKTNSTLLEMNSYELHQTIHSMNVITVSIMDKQGEVEEIHYQQRDLGTHEILYMVNHSQSESFDCTIRVKGQGKVQYFNLEKGNQEEISYQCEEEVTQFRRYFSPMQSHCIILEKGSVVTRKEVEERYNDIEINLQDEWLIDSVDDNALTLDYCDYQIDDEPWVKQVHTIQLMNILLIKKKRCIVKLRFAFDVKMNLEKNKSIFLVIESADQFEIKLNDTPISIKNQDYWKDHAFNKIDVKPWIKLGQNEVILTREFYQSPKVYETLFCDDILESEINKLTYDVELESIYIVGDFGVVSESMYDKGERKALITEGPFSLVDQKIKVNRGNLTEQGFTFFAGTMTLCQNIDIQKNKMERYFIRFDHIAAPMAKLFVNGKQVGLLCWQPYALNVTDFLIEGTNEICIQLFSSNRNLLGPHHHKEGELHNVGPYSFFDQPNWIDTYCFVDFGF